jgi:hypothetical protein
MKQFVTVLLVATFTALCACAYELAQIEQHLRLPSAGPTTVSPAVQASVKPPTSMTDPDSIARAREALRIEREAQQEFDLHNIWKPDPKHDAAVKRRVAELQREQHNALK